MLQESRERRTDYYLSEDDIFLRIGWDPIRSQGHVASKIPAIDVCNPLSEEPEWP